MSFLETGEGIVLLSGHRGRVLCCGDTEDPVRRPPTVTGFNEEVHKMEHGTCQFQRIGSVVPLQEFNDIPVLRPRRHHDLFFIIHCDPD